MSDSAFDESGAKVQRAQSVVRQIRGVGRAGGIDAENGLVARFRSAIRSRTRAVGTRSRRRMTAVSVAAVLTLTGCGSDVLDNPYEKPSPTVTADAAAVLGTLPSLEDTEVQIQSAVEQIAAFVDTLVPGREWTWTRDRSSGGCLGRYGDTEGKLVYSKKYASEGPIPDAVWPAVFERARTLAAAVGATEHETFQNNPGNHYIRFYSAESTSITVASRGNAVIASSTGCRLPQAKIPGPQTPQPPVAPNP